MKSFYITTAIDYVNGSPHLGHAYEKVLTDVIARFRRQMGDRVHFLTGTDEHGQKVQASARKQGVPAQEYVDRTSAEFRALYDRLGWEPEYTFEQGIAETVDWYLANQAWVKRVLDGSYRLERIGTAV